MSRSRKRISIPRASGNEPGPVSPKAWNLVSDAIELLFEHVFHGSPLDSPDIGWRQMPAGLVPFLKRRQSSSGSASGICPFGQITTWMDGEVRKTGIRGGLILCGPHSWNIPDQEIDLETPGSWLVSMEVSVTVNMDDDESLLLPGISTGTKPTAFDYTSYTGVEDYPTGTAPSLPGGTGTLILAVGILTVTASGSASIIPTGCGSFTLEHCGGSLSYTRASE